MSTANDEDLHPYARLERVLARSQAARTIVRRNRKPCDKALAQEAYDCVLTNDLWPALEAAMSHALADLPGRDLEGWVCNLLQRLKKRGLL